MKFYLQFNPSNELCGRYDSFNEIPSDAIEVTEDLINKTINEVDGIWKRDPESGEISKHPFPGPTQEQLENLERVWRDVELDRADIALNLVQDSDPKSVGTVTEWRAYRKALRALPEHELFPAIEARPVAPDAPIEDPIIEEEIPEGGE